MTLKLLITIFELIMIGLGGAFIANNVSPFLGFASAVIAGFLIRFILRREGIIEEEG